MCLNYFKNEQHLFGHNFTGKNTRTDLRLDEDGRPREWSQPVNVIDRTALDHDIGYELFGGNKYGEHILDKIMVKELDDIPYSTLTSYEKLQKFLVRNAINLKQKLGFGIGESESDTKELHHRIVRNFQRRKVIVHNKDDIWSMDLIEMPIDKGYKYINSYRFI
jgi:hypothetical protein